jgi:Flp pilus assembly protein TadG
MRNLGRPLLRLLGRDDRGAIGVLVAVLIGAGVLLGMGALAIDVGQIYQNRAELQNGADAAALAIATQCSTGTCPASPISTAGMYATANASTLTQDAAGVNVVCGSGTLGSCASVVGTGLTNCPADPPTGTNFVDVQTETKLASGSHLLPPVFAETLVGGTTYDGTTVKACAQAEWGSSGALAFTISNCEFNVATGGTTTQPGSLYWNLTANNGLPNPSVPADVQYDTQFLVHSAGNQNSDCPTGPANHAVPGAFGWTAGATNGTNTNCVTAITDTNGVYTYGTDPGSSSQACASRLDALWQSRTPALVPVYSSVTGNGKQKTQYTLAGYVQMIITGFNIPGGPGASESDWLNPGLFAACTGSTTCIDGILLSDPLLPPSAANTSAAGNVKLTG